MLSNQTVATPIIPGDGIAIATISTPSMFATLRIRRLGSLIELATELSIFSGRANRWLAEPLAREVFDDDEDAISVAFDMERAAIRRMTELGGGDPVDDGGLDFQDSLIAHLLRTERDTYPAAAE